MAEAAAHHEKMEDFMGAEIFVTAVENRKLQSVNNTADCIDDTAGKEPHKGFPGKAV